MPVSLEFLGGAGTVTGSKSVLRFEDKVYLIDCGLFQGPKELRNLNWQPFPIDPKLIDAIFLTHAHLDHSGYLPRLYKQGYRGPVYCSDGTADLVSILLLDAGKIQEEDAHFANQTKYSHHFPAMPLFDVEDAKASLTLIKPHPRNEWIQITNNLSVRFTRSGHIVGSSFIEFLLTVSGQPKKLIFSGDIGHDRAHAVKGPADLLEADALVLESTYGDRSHSREDVKEIFSKICKRVFERKGVLVIPAFAVGRTQEILYLLRLLEDSGQIPHVPVVLDSPMAQAATEVFLKHSEDHLLDPTELKRGQGLFPKIFEYAETPDQSMYTCMRDGPLTVIAGAGMLNGGRILHHLKRRLPQKENLILFVGYQAEGTKGRFLQDQGKTVGSMRIHHREVPVEAEIATLPSLSAHGDSKDMLEWLGRFQRMPKNVFINHGSPHSAMSLSQKIQEKFGIEAICANSGMKTKLWQ